MVASRRALFLPGSGSGRFWGPVTGRRRVAGLGLLFPWMSWPQLIFFGAGGALAMIVMPDPLLVPVPGKTAREVMTFFRAQRSDCRAVFAETPERVPGVG